MSTAGTAITPCEAIQRPLNDFFRTCPSTRRTGTPTLIYTNSPQNKSGISTLIQDVSGKKKTARLTYTQPRPITDVTEVASCDMVCDATTEVGDLYADYTIECTDGLQIEGKVRLTDWNEACKGNNLIIMETLQNMLDALIPRVAQKQAEEMNPLIGNWSSDVNPSWITADEFLEVETLTSTGANNPLAFERIELAKQQTGFCAPTLITGGTDMYSYWRLMRVGCCTNDGIDALRLLQEYGEAVVYDRWIAAEFGNDVSLMIQNQSIQLLTATWNPPMLDLGGMVGLDMTYRNGFQTVIMDPISMIPVDLNIKEDCGVVHIVMTATTKTVGLPNDMYPAGHPNEFVNFVTGIQVNNP